jgi:hypothetical protein
MATTEELLTELVAVSREQLQWHRAAALPQVRETVDGARTRTQLRRAYELFDGTRTGVEVAAEVGTTHQSVSNWTKFWRDLGIANADEEGHVRHIASLKSLRLPIEVDGG